MRLIRLLPGVVVGLVLVIGVTGLRAQEAAECAARLAELVEASKTVCADLQAGQACTDGGEIIPLAGGDRLETAGGDELTSALVRVASGTGDGPVTLALFGGAQLVNLAETGAEPVTLPVTNTAGYNLNLRGGPGTDYDVVAIFGWDEQGVMADGRSADGRWVRVTVEEGYAWVAASLVKVDGDVNTLPALDGSPVQAFQLDMPEESSCTEGLLMRYNGQSAAQLRLNGVELDFRAALALAQAPVDEQMEIYVLDGRMIVRAGGEAVTAETGQTVTIPLGGEDGLMAEGAPEVTPAYGFDVLQDLPLALVTDESLRCTVGILSETAGVSLMIQPEAGAAEAAPLVTGTHYPVNGFTLDDGGERWWQVEGGWVRAADVLAVGDCEAVVEVGGMTVASQPVTVGSAAFASEFVPAGRSIWQAQTGTDNMSGECSSPPLPICNHLVAITPNGNTITWLGQEPQPYTMLLTADNTYSYTGRNYLNTATITLELVFSSPTAWTMTFAQVFDVDPTCTHTLYYSAVPR